MQEADAQAVQQPIFPLAEDEFVMIPGGVFNIESQDEQVFVDSYDPLSQVEVEAFEMMRRPVTFSQYEHYCAEKGVKPPADQGLGRGEQPLINVSYWEARQYCYWLNSKQQDYIYRLPTELEWEYVCRAGTGSEYWATSHSGEKIRHSRKCSHTGRDFLVGLLPANPWGLFDMHGNIWEWCACEAEADAKPQHSKGRFMSFRGGAWYQVSSFIRSVYRQFNQPDAKEFSLGFRLARDSR